MDKDEIFRRAPGLGAHLGMITLAAEDPYETATFYNELLGLEVLEEDEYAGRARLRTAGGLILEIHSGGWGSEGPKTARQNPVSLCLRVPDLDAAMFELEHRGVYLLQAPENGLGVCIDPEGNRVYLYDTEEPPVVPDGWDIERGE